MMMEIWNNYPLHGWDRKGHEICEIFHQWVYREYVLSWVKIKLFQNIKGYENVSIKEKQVFKDYISY